jgi:type VI secretion system protein ImpM
MSETALSLAVPGWWGKLPHLGDFASRRLPDSFIAGWDEWLRLGLASAREALGPRWLEGYLVAPIVRFWLAPGLLGDASWTGLVMPSMDRVGRHFPLTLAWPGLPLAPARAASQRLQALDAALRRVLDVNFTVDDLERALAQAVASSPSPLPQPLSDGDGPDAAARDGGERGSVWWLTRAGGELSCRFDALPPAAAFVALFGSSG